MKSNMNYDLGLRKLEQKELQVKGGIGIKRIAKIWKIIKEIADFISDYENDFLDGIKLGWKLKRPFERVKS